MCSISVGLRAHLLSTEYYLANKERIKEKRKAINKYREEHNPLMLLLATSRNVSIRRKQDFDLDIEYMYNLWDNQNGKCYYTGLEMVLLGAKSPYKISIDRIDSNKNYSVDNCVLCCQCINYAKNMYSVEEFRLFLKNTYNSKDFISFINE